MFFSDFRPEITEKWTEQNEMNKKGWKPLKKSLAAINLQWKFTQEKSGKNWVPKIQQHKTLLKWKSFSWVFKEVLLSFFITQNTFSNHLCVTIEDYCKTPDES